MSYKSKLSNQGDRTEKAFIKRAVFQQLERVNMVFNKFNDRLVRVEVEHQQQQRSRRQERRIHMTKLNEEVSEEMKSQRCFRYFARRDDHDDILKQQSFVKDNKFDMLVPSYENECTLKREVERKEEKKDIEKEKESSKQKKEKEEKDIESKKKEKEEKKINSEQKVMKEERKIEIEEKKRE